MTHITRPQLEEAARLGLLQPEQVEPLWQHLATSAQQTASFRTSHILYYLGGLLAIGAMSMFMNLGWMMFGGWGLFGLSLAYALVGLLATERLLHGLKLRVPAGILATFVVVLTPLAVLGLLLLYQLWLFAWVLWWSWANPGSTRFMEIRIAELRQKNPQAELKYQWVPYDRISDHLKRAIIASEDAKFVDHEGFDWEGIQEALEKNGWTPALLTGPEFDKFVDEEFASLRAVMAKSGML